MKKIKLLVVALVAMFGFIACDKHECNDYDHSADIVGTWTCLQDGYAEALVIMADGSAVSTGYDGTEYWENVAGNIVVEGNKMTIKMSKEVSTLKDVVLYAFQDADCSQLHFYMHKTAFVNFHTNMQAKLMASMDEQFDINNADAVNAIYNEINNAVETINVSLVME